MNYVIRRGMHTLEVSEKDMDTILLALSHLGKTCPSSVNQLPRYVHNQLVDGLGGSPTVKSDMRAVMVKG